MTYGIWDVMAQETKRCARKYRCSTNTREKSSMNRRIQQSNYLYRTHSDFTPQASQKATCIWQNMLCCCFLLLLKFWNFANKGLSATRDHRFDIQLLDDKMSQKLSLTIPRFLDMDIWQLGSTVPPWKESRSESRVPMREQTAFAGLHLQTYSS